MPGDSRIEQDSGAVVVEVSEAPGGAIKALDGFVYGFDGTVRGAAGTKVGQHLCAPAVEGGGQAGDLGNVDLGGPLEEHLEPGAGVEDVGGVVDVANQLLRGVGAGDLLVGVAGGQTGRELGRTRLVEVLACGQQQLADAVEGVVLAAAVAQRLVLHPPANVVDGGVGEALRVEASRTRVALGSPRVEWASAAR